MPVVMLQHTLDRVSARDEAVVSALGRLWKTIQVRSCAVVPDVQFRLTSGRLSSCTSINWDDHPVIACSDMGSCKATGQHGSGRTLLKLSMAQRTQDRAKVGGISCSGDFAGLRA